MEEKIKESFENWTTYDDWLINNYPYYNITSVNEVTGEDGKSRVEVEYEKKPGVEKPEEKGN